MKEVGYLIRMDDKPQVENQVLTNRYISPNPSSKRRTWPTYEDAKKAWKIYYNKGLELGIDHKQFTNVTIVEITIDEKEIEKL